MSEIRDKPTLKIWMYFEALTEIIFIACVLKLVPTTPSRLNTVDLIFSRSVMKRDTPSIFETNKSLIEFSFLDQELFFP